jgi:hypothetical protein
MSGAIWLITEDEADSKAVQEILYASGFVIKVIWLQTTGGGGGIYRLVEQLETLIEYALKKKANNDCVAVLHDADEHKQPNRETYDEIRRICKKHNVYHVVAKDELEAWLLADAGICRWLGIKHEGWDSQKEPSRDLERFLKKLNPRMKYQGHYRAEVLKHLNGDNLSPSLKKALKHLENAPCIHP